MNATTVGPRIQEVTVAEVMSRELVSIASESTLRDLMTLLVETGISGVPVVDGDEVVGVVSVRDLIEFESETPSGSGQADGWEEWDEDGGGDDALPGAFFVEMDGAADAAARFRAGGEADGDSLAAPSVAEVMTRRLVTIEGHALLREAAAIMGEAGVHRLLVLEEGRLTGIVTTSDLVRALARYG